MFPWTQSAKYTQVAEFEVEKQTEPSRKESRRVYAIWYPLCILSALLLGFVAGQYMTWSPSEDYIAPYNGIQQIWNLNTTFAGVPSAETERAWQSLVPVGRGFITHPQLAPHGKSVSVFHQLHCLHTLQLAYYTQVNKLEALGDSEAFIISLGANTELEHIQHCFDYIRQALVCAADTNLEEPDPATGGTNGWGIQRTCRDYSAVVAWAEKWRNNDEGTILSGKKHFGHENRIQL